MNMSGRGDPDPLPLTMAERVDRACDAFEAELALGATAADRDLPGRGERDGPAGLARRVAGGRAGAASGGRRVHLEGGIRAAVSE